MFQVTGLRLKRIKKNRRQGHDKLFVRVLPRLVPPFRIIKQEIDQDRKEWLTINQKPNQRGGDLTVDRRNLGVRVKLSGQSKFPAREAKEEKPIEISIAETSVRKTVKDHATIPKCGSGSRHEIPVRMTGYGDSDLSGRSQNNETIADFVSQTELSDYPTQSGCMIKGAMLESLP
jgi:hypothetical protein